MGYSEAMTSRVLAPDLTEGYPSKGAKLGPAWNEAWRILRRSTEPKDGRVLAAQVAVKHDLAPATVVALLSRMALGGHLERIPRKVTVPVTKAGKTYNSSRVRTFYRVPGHGE